MLVNKNEETSVYCVMTDQIMKNAREQYNTTYRSSNSDNPALRENLHQLKRMPKISFPQQKS